MNKVEMPEEDRKIYKYKFGDGHVEYSPHLGVEGKEELEKIHGKLIVKSEV